MRMLLLRIFSAIFVSLALFACERDDLLLLGEWQAVSVMQGQDSLRIDPTEIGFVFRPDNRYTFRSTLRYEEAGEWRYQRGFLFAQDTTQADSPERIVAVDKLNADTLEIRMLADTVEQRVLLLKQH